MLIFPKPSLLMRIAKFAVGLVPSNFKPGKVERLWKNVLSRNEPIHAEPPWLLGMKHQIGKRLVNGQVVFEVSNPRNVSEHHIIYLHGGGYVNPLHPAHWSIISSLIQHTNANLTLPTYPLAPERNHRDALSHLEDIYLETVAKHPGKKVVLCGDSAGGGLALALAAICQEKRLPMPAQLVLFAPWLDITLSNPAMADVEASDIMLGVEGLRKAGLMWAAGTDPKNPLLSPLFGSVARLPPTTIFQGTADIFIVDARSFAMKADDEHAPVQLFEYEGAFHVHVFVPFTPEAQDTFKRVGQMLRLACS